VIRKHNDAPTYSKRGNRCGECGAQSGKLIVDGNAQRLKDTRCGMDSRWRTVSLWHALFDERCKLFCCGDWGTHARCNNGSRDLRRVGLFAVVTKDLLKLCSARLCKQLRRRLTAPSVKAEVEEAAGANPETSLAVDELVGGESEVEVDAINLAEPCIGDCARKVRATPVECGEAVAESSESHATHLNRATIRINAEQESAWPRSLKYRFGVTATTEVGVNVGPIRAHR
jgi:hypothetical protein